MLYAYVIAQQRPANTFAGISLYEVNPDDASLSFIGELPELATGLDVAPDGALYASNPASIYLINPDDASGVVVSTLASEIWSLASRPVVLGGDVVELNPTRSIN